MDEDFKRALLFVLGLYLFLSFSLGKAEGGEGENGGALMPFDLPVF